MSKPVAPASHILNTHEKKHRYVDGEIVREGPYGDQGDGAYSAGVSTSHSTKPKSQPPTDARDSTQRGGAGNIGSPMVRPSSRAPHDVEMIPELAVRDSTDETYHTGVSSRELFHLFTFDLFYD